MTRLLSLVVALSASGCFMYEPVRAGSLDHLRDTESRAVFPAREEQVMEDLSALMTTRGYVRADKREVHKAVTYYIYKGKRRTITDVRAGGGTLVVEGHELGSWFVARVSGGQPSTEVLLLGKPTVDGQEVCADSDAVLLEADYWCRDTKVRKDYGARGLLKGREEAEVVRGVLSELKEKYRVR